MRRFILAVVALCLMTGCSLVSKFQEMPVKQRLLWMMRTWLAEYADIQNMAQYYSMMPENAQKVLRWRHKLLMEIHPMIGKMLKQQEAGEPLSIDLENEIVEQLNRLMALDPVDVEKNAPPEPKQPEPEVS